jgi:hypothetical protein
LHPLQARVSVAPWLLPKSCADGLAPSWRRASSCSTSARAAGGNIAIPAALGGAKVVGLDVTPELFEHARRHAADAGVEAEWVEGDA